MNSEVERFFKDFVLPRLLTIMDDDGIIIMLRHPCYTLTAEAKIKFSDLEIDKNSTVAFSTLELYQIKKVRKLIVKLFMDYVDVIRECGKPYEKSSS